MLVRCSTALFPSLVLLTLGETCTYGLLGEQGSVWLVNPGASAHASSLPQRLKPFGISMSDIKGVLITHVASHTVGALPFLRQAVPALEFIVPAPIALQLASAGAMNRLVAEDALNRSWFPGSVGAPPVSPQELQNMLKPDRIINDSDVLAIGDETSVRVLVAPGHTSSSFAYLVQPYRFLISDQTFGYFNGRNLTAPGADDSLGASVETIKRFDLLELGGIGLPYKGALTGTLVKKHLGDLVRNTEDLARETAAALAEGVPPEDVRRSIRDAFYVQDTKDPFLQHSLESTFEAVWRQLSSKPLEASSMDSLTANEVTN